MNDDKDWIKRFIAEQEAYNASQRRTDADGFWSPPGWEEWNQIETIRRYRRLKELSQHELAMRAGMSQADLSRLEAGGDARWSTLYRLADAMGCEAKLRLKPRPP